MGPIGKGIFLIVQDDGNTVLYKQGVSVWDTQHSIIPHEKREELPMSEEALRNWYWAGVIVSALALWVVWYMLVRT